MARKKLPVKNKRYPRYLPEFLILLGTFLVSLSVVHNLFRLKSLSIDARTVNSYIETKIPTEDLALPVHIFIPWNTDAEIVGGVYNSGNWTVSPGNVSFLLNSSRPKGDGNIIIYGHNKRSLLGNIRALKGGEQITLTLKSGEKRIYVVSKVQELKPSITSPLLPTDSETLTLFTCSGPLDSLRFVVTAHPL